ncbi:tail fiber domain-containing protein [Diaphorobacter caeni]|uniref:tail fiber domain-containing protein n=1 Tax=Diaphorobacter caeni TaxID=2784387 RepID=UPI00188E336E|nr:tail fiber domain-containing protein [Diaphorobacter caeni]MBF5003371.1 tail fiber domain-containing protein [Diaphorobacter caeni]
MANEITAHYGLPLPDPAAFLEYDVFRLRDAITGIDSSLHQAALNLAQRAQELDALIEQRASALAQSKLDVTATVGVANGGTGATAAASARANLNVPTRTGGEASGTWGINISGSSASAATAGTANSATYANAASGQWTGAAMNGDSAGADTTSSVVIRHAGGAGDGALAAMSFVCAGAYGIKMYLRPDGYFGIGGSSRSPWSWYTDTAGNMVAGGNVTAYSDPRLKRGFKRIADPFKILNALDGGTFFWRKGIQHTSMKAGRRDYGVLADQVQAVMPEIVTESIEIGGQKYLTVAYEKLVPVLIEAVKELDREVRQLKKDRA